MKSCQRIVKKKTPLFRLIRLLLNFLLVFGILSSFVVVIYQLFLPSANEYDDPTTLVQESFPWNPNIVSDFPRVLYLLGMGVARHIALLPNNITTVELVSMVGYIFFVLFIYRMRKTFVSHEKMGIHNYVEWGIGSIVGAIIYLAGTVSPGREIDVAIGVIGLSVACLILYLIHPHLGLFFALEEKIGGTKK